MFFTGYSRAADEVLAEQVTKSSERRPGDDRQPPLREGPRPAAARRAREGRRRGVRRPDARALAEQEEAVELDVERRASTTSTTSAANAGARGGKLVGAGAGGFLMFYAEDTRRAARGDARGGSRRAAVRLRPGRQHRCSSASEARRAVRHPGRRSRHPDVAGRRRPCPRRCCRSPAGRSPTGSWAGWPARASTRSSTASATSASRSRDHVGDGSRVGPARSATSTRARSCAAPAGALRLALDAGVLAERFLVLYGDSWLQVDPAAVLRAPPSASGAPALMTVYENDGRFDASNVVYADGPGASATRRGWTRPPPEMRWIDYGLSVLTRDLVAERVPPANRRRPAPSSAPRWPPRASSRATWWTERFYEIGSPTGWPRSPTLLTGRG